MTTQTQTVATETASKGRGKQALFLNPNNVLICLNAIAGGAQVLPEPFSAHHVRQLMDGVSGGPFGPGKGLGFVEIVKGELPEGEKGRRPRIMKVNEAGLAFIKSETKRQEQLAREAKAAEQKAERAARAAEEKAAREAAKAAKTHTETPASEPVAETAQEQEQVAA